MGEWFGTVWPNIMPTPYIYIIYIQHILSKAQKKHTLERNHAYINAEIAESWSQDSLPSIILNFSSVCLIPPLICKCNNNHFRNCLEAQGLARSSCKQCNSTWRTNLDRFPLKNLDNIVTTPCSMFLVFIYLYLSLPHLRFCKILRGQSGVAVVLCHPLS